MSNDHGLDEGQMLLEVWQVEFKGMNRRNRPVEEWVECRIVNMHHGTIYGGAYGVGKTVDEARLEAVLGLARAITDDPMAFDHDAEQLFLEETHRWWLGSINELQECLLEGESDKERRKLKRRIKRLERMMAEWQEHYDYWPEEASGDQEARRKARADQIRTDSDKRRAAGIRLGKAARHARSVSGTVAS